MSTTTSEPAAAAPATTSPPPPARRKGRRWLRALLVFGGIVAVAGGAYFWLIDSLPLPESPRGPAPLPEALDVLLQGDPSVPLAAELSPEIEVEGHRVLPGRLTVRRLEAEQSHPVTFHLYLADGVEGPAPCVVVTPILGGDNEIAKIVADDLASHGLHAVLVDRVKGTLKEKLPDVEVRMRDLVADRRRVIDWLATKPGIVTPGAVGAYGVSLGGITTVMLAAVEPRIRAAVSVMAGGPLPTVLARSVEPECQMLRTATGLPEDATPEQLRAFEEQARAVITTEPFTLARYADPRKLLLFTTRRDTSVPSSTQLTLREALGSPETISLPTGHYSAILYLPVVLNRARTFLKTRLFNEG